MKVEIDKNYLLVNGRKLMLRAGELHYARVSRDQWADRLRRMREAGLNTLSAYFFWNWHELREGEFDFTGKTHPERDIEHFLDLVGESGLMLISRQGPWACAEWLNGGFPQWLFHKYPEIMSLDSTGRVTSRMEPHAPVVSYLHPTYLEYSRKWLRAFIPLLRKFDEEYPDKLLMVQADNETCYGFHPSPFDTDYNPINIGSKEDGTEGLYQKWLKGKYGDISTLNNLYGTSYGDIGEVDPPRSNPKSKGQLLTLFDWAAFKEDIVTDYLQEVASVFREAGIKVPISANEITTAYGNPSNMYKKSRHFFVGIDMYPSSIKDLIDATGKVIEPIEIMKAQCPEQYPTSLEFQGGWYNAKVPLNTTHLHQRISYAHGLKGISYYMWVGGTNPKGWGTTGESYDYDCAIQEDGRDGRRLPVMKRFLDFTQANEETILESRALAEIGVSYYHPYFYWCGPLSTKSAGLTYNIAAEMSRSPSFEAILQMAGFNLEYFDLEHINTKAVSAYKLLSVPLYDFLDKGAQEALLGLIRNGSTVLIGPTIPYMDGNMESCTVLRDVLKIKVLENVETESVELKNSGSLKVARVNVLESEGAGAVPIAKTSSTSQICGYLKKVGRGQIVVLGFLPTNLRDVGGIDTFLSFLSSLKVKSVANAGNRDVNVIERVSPNGSALLYLSNLSGEDVETSISFIDPGKSSKVTKIPRVKIAKRSAIAWPINLKTELGEIKYLTSEITRIQHRCNDEIVIHAWGYEGTNGKVAVDLKGQKKRAEEKLYKHSAKGETLEFRNAKGTIKIIVEGMKPLSDLP
nr:beta-galactosidase [Candidatus Njordarchaeum guaymaensis]